MSSSSGRRFGEILVFIYKSTRRHIPQDGNLNSYTYCHINLTYNVAGISAGILKVEMPVTDVKYFKFSV
jgi:hypothetical protein